MPDASLGTIRPVKAPDVVLICEKCSHKLGPAGKAMRKNLKHALKSRRWGKVRLVKTSCFAICPKRRQVLASTRSLKERRLLVAEENSSIAEILDYLLATSEDGSTRGTAHDRRRLA
jgi:hypothetical protein